MPRKVSRQTILIVIFLLLVVFFVTTFRMGVVRGDSMFPTYHSGQIVLVRRLNRFSAPLKRGDVILMQQGRDVIIKRIYRLPGETIPPDEFPGLPRFASMSSTLDYYEQQEEPTPQGPMVRLIVPKDYLVVLGDNPKVSEDSRFFGPVPLRDILGVVVRAPAAPPAPQMQPGRTDQMPTTPNTQGTPNNDSARIQRGADVQNLSPLIVARTHSDLNRLLLIPETTTPQRSVSLPSCLSLAQNKRANV